MNKQTTPTKTPSENVVPVVLATSPPPTNPLGTDAIRQLFFGDNLDVMKNEIAPLSIDLVYLDPPFKSSADYNVLFKVGGLKPDEAQMTAFKDTWTWDDAAHLAFSELQDASNIRLVKIINALHDTLGESPMMAYLVMMAIRLNVIHRLMKPTASLYLHCDPTASHYLKIILDMIFGPQNHLNEIIWRRTGAHNNPARFGPIHDVIHFYRKSDAYRHRILYQPYMVGHVDSYFNNRDANGRYWTNSVSAQLPCGLEGARRRMKRLDVTPAVAIQGRCDPAP